jgi:DNA-binding XRE family transcriptional regulator
METLTADQIGNLTYARRLAASAGSIRAIRLKAGLSQADLARTAGLDCPAMCRIEQGRHKPMGPKGAALGDLLKRIGDGSL